MIFRDFQINILHKNTKQIFTGEKKMEKSKFRRDMEDEVARIVERATTEELRIIRDFARNVTKK